MRFGYFPSAMVLSLSLVCTGCMSTDEDGFYAFDENIGTETEGLVVSSEFHWSQGSAPVPMGPASDRVCFLTRVTGRFAGGGETVHAYINGNSWYLGGTSYQVNVAATARCVLVAGASQYSTEYSWSQGAYATHMGSGSNRACFLTRMSGRFKGGGEEIWAYRSGPSWYLGGRSQQSGVSAGARCVNVSWYSGAYSWSQGAHSVYMGSQSSRACFLTRVTGRFEGGGESVRVFLSGSSWYLGGNSRQRGVGGSARCMDN